LGIWMIVIGVLSHIGWVASIIHSVSGVPRN
jgi:hypothetical protein